MLGPLPIILGSIAGWRWFAEAAGPSPRNTLVASVCSLLAGIVGSLLVFWNLAEKRQRHLAAGATFKSLEHDARRAGKILGLAETTADLKAIVGSLGERFNRANENCIPPADCFFNRARKKIALGVFQTKVDEPAQEGKGGGKL